MLKKKKSTFQCRQHGFQPWSGKIRHTTVQLSPCATTTEDLVPGARAPRQEKPLLNATRESLRQQRRHNAAKNKQINKINLFKKKRIWNPNNDTKVYFLNTVFCNIIL